MKDRPIQDTIFYRLGQLAIRMRWPLVALCVAMVALGALALPKLRVDTSNVSFFVDGDAALERYQAFKDTFGSDEVVFVLVETPDAFTEPHLSRLIALHHELEQLPHVIEVRSPLCSNVVREDGDLVEMITVEDQDRTSTAQRAALRKLVLEYAPFRNMLIDESGTRAGYLIRLEDMKSAPNMGVTVVAGLNAVRDKAPYSSYRIGAVGTPINSVIFADLLFAQIRIFVISGLVVIAVLLYWLLRSVGGMLGPLVVVAATVVITFGLMAATGVPLSTMSSILVTLMLCVGIADTMHVAVAYRHQLQIAPEAREHALCLAYSEAGPPCLLTSLTTAAGFLALYTSNLVPIGNLGLFAAAGCIVAFVLTMAVFPVFLLAWRPQRSVAQFDRWSAGLAGLAARIARSPGKWLMLTALPCMLASAGISQIEVNHNFLHYMSEQDRLRQDIEWVGRVLGGPIGAEIVLDTGRAGGVKNAEFMGRVHSLQRWIEAEFPSVRSVRSEVDTLIEFHRLMTSDREVALPETDAGIAQLLLLHEMINPKGLERYVRADERVLRIALRLGMTGSRAHKAMLVRLEAEMATRFADLHSAHVTGGAYLLARMADYVLETQLRSFSLALLIISIVLVILARTRRLALAAVLANIVPIAVALGTMGWLGIFLEVSNVLVATVAMGIVVDDTIHFVYRFRKLRDEGESEADAIVLTLSGAGRALVFTTLVLVANFALYGLSSLQNIRDFGLLAAVVFTVALVCDVALIPALLLLRRNSQRNKG